VRLQGQFIWARIIDINPSAANQLGNVSLRVFDIGQQLHPVYDMPVLHPTINTAQGIIVIPANVRQRS
jgi:hypothetical protein